MRVKLCHNQWKKDLRHCAKNRIFVFSFSLKTTFVHLFKSIWNSSEVHTKSVKINENHTIKSVKITLFEHILFWKLFLLGKGNSPFGKGHSTLPKSMAMLKLFVPMPLLSCYLLFVIICYDSFQRTRETKTQRGPCLWGFCLYEVFYPITSLNLGDDQQYTVTMGLFLLLLILIFIYISSFSDVLIFRWLPTPQISSMLWWNLLKKGTVHFMKWHVQDIGMNWQ